MDVPDAQQFTGITFDAQQSRSMLLKSGEGWSHATLMRGTPESMPSIFMVQSHLSNAAQIFVVFLPAKP